MSIRIIFSLALLLLLAGCVGDGDTVTERAVVPADSPNSFLLFPNTQASLGAGVYQLDVGPQTGTTAGTFTVTVTMDDGSVQTFNGSWPVSGVGQIDITMDHAGGLKIVAASTVSTSLVLKRKNNAQIVASGTDVIDLPASRISSATYGQAYYEAVDPAHERTTLTDWKLKNGFGAGDETHVIFRDAKDLGYGRDMYARRSGDNVAILVKNYVVILQPGSSSNYGPLNVEAAISQDSRYLIGSNAIEFSPANQDGPSDDGAMLITKFFTFDKNGNRITSADLDGRGVKHMPGMCLACHGGQTLPLDVSGKFQTQSLRSSKLNLIDAALLEYSPQIAYQRPQLEAGIRTMNEYVHGSFKKMRDDRPAGTQGKWSADFALALLEGRYGPALTGSTDDAAVPDGWKQNPAFPSRPVGVEQLFKKVLEPHCIGCHALQGTTAGEGITVPVDGNNVSLANAINFSSYEKFISYKSRIIDYVYHRGLMPMSLRNFESFWKDPKAAPSLLASFLADPSLFDANGNVLQPGHPVAKPGAARTVKSPVQLDGNASLYANSWQWAIVTGPVDAVLTGAKTARPVLSTTTGGAVTLSLTVSNSKGSNTASVNYTVNNALSPAQAQLTFAHDIAPILNTDATSQCAQSCHRAGGSYPGIPAYWTSDSGLYQRAMARVDLRDPENSKLLQKPTGLNHGGGIKIDVTTPVGQAQYNTILNWIREGAVCGSDALLCP